MKFLFYKELFQDLSQMQEQWLNEGILLVDYFYIITDNIKVYKYS